MKPLLLAIFLLVPVAHACAQDWITAPSYYTHDPQTGQRVTQHTPIAPVYVQPRGDYLQSGYRHIESQLNVGRSGGDRLHVVEEWGRPVRPYGEWQYPYRPYSVPYSMWGPPYAGLGQPWPYYYRGGYPRRPVIAPHPHPAGGFGPAVPQPLGPGGFPSPYAFPDGSSGST